MKYRKAWIALAVLAVLSPLGILAIGSAWGEWDMETIQDLTGHAPEGMQEARDNRPDAPFQEYEVPGLSGNWLQTGAGTILSALIGAGITAASAIVLHRIVRHGTIPR